MLYYVRLLHLSGCLCKWHHTASRTCAMMHGKNANIVSHDVSFFRQSNCASVTVQIVPQSMSTSNKWQTLLKKTKHMPTLCFLMLPCLSVAQCRFRKQLLDSMKHVSKQHRQTLYYECSFVSQAVCTGGITQL